MSKTFHRDVKRALKKKLTKLRSGWHQIMVTSTSNMHYTVVNTLTKRIVLCDFHSINFVRCLQPHLSRLMFRRICKFAKISSRPRCCQMMTVMTTMTTTVQCRRNGPHLEFQNIKLQSSPAFIFIYIYTHTIIYMSCLTEKQVSKKRKEKLNK